MPTDWTLIRKLMNATIDACESAELLGVSEAHRTLPTGTSDVTVQDVLTSAWTYPENTRYEVIRARQQLNDNRPYKIELARAVENVAQVCGELIGANNLSSPVRADPLQPSMSRSVQEAAEGLARWYQEEMTPQLEHALRPER